MSLGVRRSGLQGDPRVTQLSSQEFDARCVECDQDTRNVLEFLRTVAEHAGPDVESPSFEAQGVGVTYWIGGRRFCRLDPKHQGHHVWVLVPGGDRIALAVAGKVSEREDGPWVTIKNMHGAVRLAPEILRAYDTAAQKASIQR